VDRGPRGRRRRRRRPEEPREALPAAATQALPEPGETAEAGGEVDKPPRSEAESEHEAEAERRRRRRGRRGGRARPRREAAETDAAAPPVAAETIEIIAFAAEEGIPREAEMMPEPAPWQPWPAEAGSDAASLAPLAGASAEPAPQLAPPPAPQSALIGGERRDEPETAVAPVPTAEIEEGIPFTSEAERVLEEAVAQAPAAHRGEPAQAAPPPAAPSSLPEEAAIPVTERPENPRRGWWQRLTQS
jgi:ribonuclease E